MPLADPARWSERVRKVLGRYAEPLLRQVAARLYRPRNHWPPPELVERCVGTLGNAAVIDRRVQGLDAPARQILALMAHSRQPCWKVGNLLELLAALGPGEGTRPVFALLEAGLLFPDLGEGLAPLANFDQWLGQSAATGYRVFSPPQVTARALGEGLGLPGFPPAAAEAKSPVEADGLEWPLRLAAVWQQASAEPLRLTLQGEFFKRDLDRLRGDALLSAAGDGPGVLPDPALLAVALAEAEGVVHAADGEMRAGALPAAWGDGLQPALASLGAALFQVETWNPQDGWADRRSTANPYPSAYLLSLLVLAQSPGAWVHPGAVEAWVVERHPYWGGRPAHPPRPTPAPAAACPVLGPFLLNLAPQLRFVDVARDAAGDWLVRVSELGRWFLGLAEVPRAAPAFPKTLLVQPNLEVIAYRQGLTPALIAGLARFAAWTGLGPACTLRLEPGWVYRGLEAGWGFEAILQVLERHGMKPVPAPVVESLRTWAAKRDRLQVYPSAALFEFASAADLEAARARGLDGVRIADRLFLVANEGLIDYRHFRLTGTRDYCLPPDPCVAVEPDGVTLTIDPVRSDLLLETELRGFAEPLERPGANGRRQYRLTPASLAAGRDRGVGLRRLDDWFRERTGRPLTPAARLLLTGPLLGPCEFRRQLVLQVGTPELADGLVQWPGTRGLIQARLGPTALAVAEECWDPLQERLRELGLEGAG
jgi:hypothetical protein